MAINPFEILEILANWPHAASKDPETKARTRRRGLLVVWAITSVPLLFGLYVYLRAPDVISDRNGALMLFAGALWMGLTVVLAAKRLRQS